MEARDGGRRDPPAGEVPGRGDVLGRGIRGAAVVAYGLVTPGEPAQLAVDQVVDLFGQSSANAMSDCFMADDVLVEGPPPADSGP